MEKSIKKQAKETWDELCELEAKMYQVEKAREEKLNSIHNRFSSLRVELADIFNREDEPEVIEFIETLTHIFGEGRTIEVDYIRADGIHRLIACDIQGIDRDKDMVYVYDNDAGHIKCLKATGIRSIWDSTTEIKHVVEIS